MKGHGLAHLRGRGRRGERREVEELLVRIDVRAHDRHGRRAAAEGGRVVRRPRVRARAGAVGAVVPARGRVELQGSSLPEPGGAVALVRVALGEGEIDQHAHHRRLQIVEVELLPPAVRRLGSRRSGAEAVEGLEALRGVDGHRLGRGDGRGEEHERQEESAQKSLPACGSSVDSNHGVLAYSPVVREQTRERRRRPERGSKDSLGCPGAFGVLLRRLLDLDGVRQDLPRALLLFVRQRLHVAKRLLEAVLERGGGVHCLQRGEQLTA